MEISWKAGPCFVALVFYVNPSGTPRLWDDCERGRFSMVLQPYSFTIFRKSPQAPPLLETLNPLLNQHGHGSPEFSRARQRSFEPMEIDTMHSQDSRWFARVPSNNVSREVASCSWMQLFMKEFSPAVWGFSVCNTCDQMCLVVVLPYTCFPCISVHHPLLDSSHKLLLVSRWCILNSTFCNF